MEAPSDSEIGARLERATRSALSSSCFSSLLSKPCPLPGPAPPPLKDLLAHLGPSDAPRCPNCRAPLLLGPRSLLCLACAAPLLPPSPPSFPSSIAYRRLLDALNIDGLETDPSEGEEESSDLELDTANNTTSPNFSSPLESGGQKTSLCREFSSELGKPEPNEMAVLTPTPTTSTSVGLGSETLAEPTILASEHGEKRHSILDYSAKLEGISLEDFFTGQIKPQDPILEKPAIITDNLSGRGTSLKTSGILVHNDSLFWDPLSESIIPDGYDLMASRSEAFNNSLGYSKENTVDKLDGVEEDDDPFSSWEGDFQSAAPAAEVSTASSFTFGPPVTVQPSTLGNFEDLFGNILSEREPIAAENGWNQGNNGLVVATPGDNGDLFGLQVHMENPDALSLFSSVGHLETDIQRSMDMDGLFFGSGWQSVQLPVSSATCESQFANISSEGNSVAELNRIDLLGPSLPNEHDLSSLGQIGILMAGDNSYDAVGDSHLTMTAMNDEFGKEQQASPSDGKTNKIVGSLLAQLHDLSFMLADKLVIKTEGKTSKPDSSG